MNRIYGTMKAYRAKIEAPWFHRPFDLNLFVVRSGNVGLWDDSVLVAFTDDGGRECVESYTVTGDAWYGEWTKPTHSDGCIYVLDQHVSGGLELGLFKSRQAMRQCKDFRYVRWPKGKGYVPSVTELQLQPSFSGNRFTHIHNRVSGYAPMKPRTDDSEGCTVFLYQHQYAGFLRLVIEQKKRYGSAIVSPTYCSLSELM